MTRSSRGGTGRRPRGRRHRPPRLAHGGQVPTAPGWPRPTPPRLARGGRRTHRDAPCTPMTPCLARGSDSWHRRVRPRRGRAHYDPDGDRRRTGAPGAGRRYPSGALRPEGRARRGVDARGRRVRTGGGPPPGGPGSSRADCGNAASSDGSGASAEKLLPARAGVLHIGGRLPRGSVRAFPCDSGALTRTSVFSGRAPMCRADPSAHGRTSTALSAEAFPHDSADPPPAGPGRMCNTAPMPHTRARKPCPRRRPRHPYPSLLHPLPEPPPAPTTCIVSRRPGLRIHRCPPRRRTRPPNSDPAGRPAFGNAARSASTSLNPRERLLGVRSRGLSDDLAG